MTPGLDFGSNHPERFIRFAYTTSLDRMAIAMQRLEKFIQQG
jgi:aspartate/methionine/tyrosine aminotransferase